MRFISFFIFFIFHRLKHLTQSQEVDPFQKKKNLFIPIIYYDFFYELVQQ